jgi:glutamyl-tRNA synthetase
MDIAKNARKYALQNAVQFGGKANPGAVIGKLLSEDPSLKSKMKDVATTVNATVKEISTLTVEQQRKELEALAPQLLEKKKAEKKGLLELKNAVEGKVITRIPPEPSKYAHIGHALSFLINYLYAEKYKGKCLVRFEDTNPELSKQEYANAILEDLKFLGINHGAAKYVSDDLEMLYGYADTLIADGNAYVCACEVKEMRDRRHAKSACDHRKASAAANKKKWKDMLARKVKPGKAVLRLKADMKSKNDVMRDPVLFRITFEEHYRHGTKYCVWPLYDFENAIEDGMSGVTHVLRSNEFGGMRVELQDFIKDALKLPKQTVIQYGRFNITDAISQGREIRRLINEGRVSGWDDPRLVTIKALRRRGIQPEAFRELAVDVGLSPTPTNIDWPIIASFNRKILDMKADRYFFVEAPQDIRVNGAPKRNVTLKLHPDKDSGKREFAVHDSFYISKKDAESLGNDELTRLMDCLNFRREGTKFVFDSLDIDTFRQAKKKRIVHWLPISGNVKASILMPDAITVFGLAEAGVKNLKPGDIIQFARFGFCRLESAGSTMKFIYCHE